MIYRKIIANVVFSSLMPIMLAIRWVPNLWDALLYGKYKYYDFHIESLGEFLQAVYSGYLITWLLALLFISLPFQLIKDYYYKKGSSLPFIKKTGVLSGIVASIIIFFGTFSNIWWDPWYYNFMYLAYALGFGLLFTMLLYFTVDRYTEKKNLEMEGQ